MKYKSLAVSWHSKIQCVNLKAEKITEGNPKKKVTPVWTSKGWSSGNGGNYIYVKLHRPCHHAVLLE